MSPVPVESPASDPYSGNEGFAEAVFRIGETINAVNAANGWDVVRPSEWESDRYKIPAILALIHSEASEALEAYRKNDRENFAEELSDVLIRVVDCSHGLGIDLGSVVLAKIAKNSTRGHRHGGKRI